jgi:hypothetical protein
MTRRDYELLEDALADALGTITGGELAPVRAFWSTVDTLADYLAADNRAFDRDLFTAQIIERAILSPINRTLARSLTTRPPSAPLKTDDKPDTTPGGAGPEAPSHA